MPRSLKSCSLCRKSKIIFSVLSKCLKNPKSCHELLDVFHHPGEASERGSKHSARCCIFLFQNQGGPITLYNANYELEELLLVFKNVAENDTSKEILIDLNVVESIFTLIEGPKISPDQKVQALELLYKLSFKIKNRNGLSEFTKNRLTEMNKSGLQDKMLAELYKRILFELNERPRIEKKRKNTSPEHVSKTLL